MDRVHGLFALGTTGEATGVSPKVRREMVERTCGLVRGRVPVWVGVTDTCVEESVEMGRFAEKAGAAGVVAAAPYYLPVEQGELMRYVKAIVERQGLPVVLYNIPALTKMGYEVETVRRLAEMGRVVGIKDSSGDIGYLRDLMAGVKREGWSVMVGMEALLAEGVKMGADGGVPAGANVWPRGFVEWWEAAVRGDEQRAGELQAGVMELQKIYRVGKGIVAIIRGVKCALGVMGICGQRMAEPWRGCGEEEREMVRGVIGKCKLRIDN